MPRFLKVIVFMAVGFVVTTVASYFLISWLSTNTHDRALEAAMSSVFVFGPLGTVVAGVVAFARSGKK